MEENVQESYYVLTWLDKNEFLNLFQNQQLKNAKYKVVGLKLASET